MRFHAEAWNNQEKSPKFFLKKIGLKIIHLLQSLLTPILVSQQFLVLNSCWNRIS